MNKETHTSDHREHGQRQAVQHQVKTDVKVAYRHPRPQRLAVCLLTVSEEVNADKGSYQRRQAHRANAHDRRDVFRPAPTGERQQDEANQWQNNG